jgi:hypothetical protein
LYGFRLGQYLGPVTLFAEKGEKVAGPGRKAGRWAGTKVLIWHKRLRPFGSRFYRPDCCAKTVHVASCEGVQQNSFFMQRNNFVTQQNNFVTQQNNFVMQQNSFVMQQNSFVMQQNSFVMQQNSFVMQQNCFFTQQNSFFTQQNNFLNRRHHFQAE